MEAPDVIIVGAGLAGLRCAIRLAQAERSVILLEAADVVGGRQRTDEVDGFLLDRGFQVLNPAYPAVRRWVDIGALALQRFPVGCGCGAKSVPSNSRIRCGIRRRFRRRCAAG